MTRSTSETPSSASGRRTSRARRRSTKPPGRSSGRRRSTASTAAPTTTSAARRRAMARPHAAAAKSADGSTSGSAATAPRPRAAIRRFDVFAEVKRLEAERRGADADEARGYGIWVAKVVAGRRFGRSAAPPPPAAGAPERRHEAAEARAHQPHELNGEPQTGETFEREIVQRMGEAFYRDVFAPAIREAVEAGEPYEVIRDRIRRPWSP